MKEATGELNMTVVTVVAIAAIAALFTIFIMPSIQANIALQTACSNIDADGNYQANVTGAAVDQSKANVSCSQFSCQAVYNGRTYNKKCSGTT
jgi:hypothetical protein